MISKAGVKIQKFKLQKIFLNDVLNDVKSNYKAQAIITCAMCPSGPKFVKFDPVHSRVKGKNNTWKISYVYCIYFLKTSLKSFITKMHHFILLTCNISLKTWMSLAKL